jgi:hypothetical protein
MAHQGNEWECQTKDPFVPSYSKAGSCANERTVDRKGKRRLSSGRIEGEALLRLCLAGIWICLRSLRSVSVYVCKISILFYVNIRLETGIGWHADVACSVFS